MKARKMFAVLSAVVLLSVLIAGRERQKPVKTMNSIYTSFPLHFVWDMPEFEHPDCIVITGEQCGSENIMHTFSRWNGDSLFFFFRVMDTDLRAYQVEQDHSLLWLDDMVEILIDTNNSKDSCWSADDIVYHVNILGAKKDDIGSDECITNPLWDGNARIQVTLFGTINDTTDVDTGYLMLIAFPWDEIGREPIPGLTLGLNIANGDNDGKGRQLFDWVGASPMRSPYAYGNLVLMKQGHF